MRKYSEGGVITSMDALSTQDLIFWNHKVYHRGWFESWQYRYVKQWIDAGDIKYAIPIVRRVETGEIL